MHTKVRSDRASLAFAVPQPEHVLLDANHRSATITVPPRQAVLYSTWRRNSANEASATCRASRRRRASRARGGLRSPASRTAGQVRGGLVQGVAALAGDPPLSLPQRHRRAGPPVRRLPGAPVRAPAPGHGAGQAADLPQRPAQVPGIGDLLPRGQDGEGLDAQVDADDGIRAAAAGRLMSCPAVNAANQRPRSNRTDTASTRAEPAATRSARRVPGSCSFTRPTRGSTACRASHRNAPVVNRTDGGPSAWI